MESVAQEKGWEMREFLWGVALPTASGWLDPKQLEESDQWKIPSTGGLGKVGDCILVTGLTTVMEKELSAEDLWGVVGIYGEIVAVKLLQKRDGYALIQYKNNSYANTAIKSLNQSTIGKMTLQVKASTNSNALNWRGSKSGLARFMCTASERPVPSVFADSSAPSPCLIMHDIPFEDLEAAKSLVSSLFSPVSLTSIDSSTLQVVFSSSEEAFLTCAELNGRHSLPNGAAVKFSFQLDF